MRTEATALIAPSSETFSHDSKLADHPLIQGALKLIRAGNYTEASKEIPRLNDLLKQDKRAQAQDALAHDCPALTARSLLAEIYYHSGDHAEVGKLLAEPIRLDNLPQDWDWHRKRGLSPCGYRRLLRARCWYVLQRGKHYYKSSDYEKASKHLDQAIEALGSKFPLESRTPTDLPRFHGILSHLYYWRGHIERHRRNYPKAFEYYRSSLEQVQENLKSSEFSEERKAAALYRIAACLSTGLGWTHYLSGNLALAESMFLSAKSLFAFAPADALKKGYTDLLLGSVYRARVGEENELLPRAIDLMEGARKEFLKHRHVFYQGRANCALALAYGLYKDEAKLNEGRRFAEYAAADARAATDWECLSKSLIAHSRIERKLGCLAKAMELARQAESEAEDHDQGLLCIEAKITQGEIYFAEDKEEAYSKAVGCFRKALSMPEPDIRQRAASYVHLGRTYLRLGDRERARKAYDDFTQIKRDIQNGFILNLANEVDSELNPQRGDVLRLDATEPQLDGKGLYTALEDKLRRFLLERALEAKNREKAIAELGISRQTFYTWKKALLGDPEDMPQQREPSTQPKPRPLK